MKRVALFATILAITLLSSCAQSKHSCSAYSQKIDRKLKKGNINKMIDYISPYIDYNEDFTISAFGQNETIHNKDELSSFLPQLTEGTPLNLLHTEIVAETKHLTNLKVLTNIGQLYMQLKLLHSENQLVLVHIDYYGNNILKSNEQLSLNNL